MTVRRWSTVVGLVGAIVCACGPIEVTVFEGPKSEEAPDPVVLGLGGHRTDDSQPDESPTITTFVLDDFEDGDKKSNDPGGWWYTVNDGTGYQDLTVTSSEETAADPGGARPPSMVLQSQADGFTEWGAALGVDIVSVGSANTAYEVAFSIAANRAAEIVFHAIDGSGSHFTRSLFISPEWVTVSVRLDELFVVEEQSVRAFDVKSATELQWFVFSETPTTVWLDDVSIRWW